MPKKEKQREHPKTSPAEVHAKVVANEVATVEKVGKGKLRYKDGEGNKLTDVDLSDVMDEGSPLYDFYNAPTE